MPRRAPAPKPPEPSSEVEFHFETLAIHAGQPPDPATGAIVTPIHPTTTYAQEGLGRHKGFEYSRTGNPTRRALEENVAALEGGLRGFGFASGMAAITTVTHLLKKGDHVVAEENVYGGTVRYFSRVAAKFGLEFTYVNASDASEVEEALREDTRMLYLESPTNPNLRLSDIEKLSALAHSRDCLVAVDNTFASPYLQQPHKLGADVVLHSATKYLGGHSDVVGGIVTTTRADVGEQLGFLQNAMGAILGPFDSWLVLRGIKTLPLRMERHCENAQRVAEFLVGHKKVAKVHFPGLKSHPQYRLARKQMRGPSGMVSFELKGGLEQGRDLMSTVRLWTLAESLGAVESLISHPATMTHGAVPKEQRERSGITDGLVRLSVGLENVEDLIRDLETALAKV